MFPTKNTKMTRQSMMKATTMFNHSMSIGKGTCCKYLLVLTDVCRLILFT